MSTNSGIDTDCMTLTRFLLAEQRRNASATGDLTQLMNAIQTAVKAISSAANRTGIAERFVIRLIFMPRDCGIIHNLYLFTKLNVETHTDYK